MWPIPSWCSLSKPPKKKKKQTNEQKQKQKTNKTKQKTKSSLYATSLYVLLLFSPQMNSCLALKLFAIRDLKLKILNFWDLDVDYN